MSISITKADKKCATCRIDLNTKKSFAEREDWESVRYCSSKCRKVLEKPLRKRR